MGRVEVSAESDTPCNLPPPHGQVSKPKQAFQTTAGKPNPTVFFVGSSFDTRTLCLSGHLLSSHPWLIRHVRGLQHVGNCHQDMMLLNLWPVGALACPQIGQTSLLLSLLLVCPGESPSFFQLADYYTKQHGVTLCRPPPPRRHLYIPTTRGHPSWSPVEPGQNQGCTEALVPSVPGSCQPPWRSEPSPQ